MLTVKELMARLKKMPPNMPVGVRMFDNLEGEVAGHVTDLVIGDDSRVIRSCDEPTKFVLIIA